jgi:hypothetical protein
MAVDVASLRRTPLLRRSGLALDAPRLLALVVAANAIVTAVLAFLRATPRYLPDEFLYSQLARSIAEGRGVRVLGEPSSLPALLEPLLTSVFWLPGDPALAFRLTQALHVVVMSAAAVPVSLLARRLGLRPSLTWFATLVAVLSPDLLYAGYATADAVGYALALCAVAAGVRALAEPTPRSQTLFLAAAGLASFARVQYVILVPAFVVASVLVEHASIRTALARFRVVYTAAAATAAAGAVLGAGVLGRYAGVGDFHGSGEAAVWVTRSGFLMALASGVAIVPGAVAWLLPSRRRSTRVRTSFAWLVSLVLASLLLAAALMAVETASERFFERYLMIGIPLVALAFGCWVDEGRPRQRIAIATGLVLIVLVARFPVSAYAVGQGAADSPLLLAVRRLGGAVGIDDASLIVALAATAALLVAIWSALERSRSPRAVCAVTVALLCAASAGAHLEDLDLSRSVAARDLGSPRGWIDASGSRDVLLLQTAGSPGPRAMNQVLWNASVTEGALLGSDTRPMDGASDRTRIRRDGTLTLAGRPVRRPLLVATSGTHSLWADARIVGRAPGFELLRPDGPARLVALAEGLSSDGWLAATSVVTVWPGADGPRRGALRVVLSLPASARESTVVVRGAGRPRSVSVKPGSRRVLAIRKTVASPWRIVLSTARPSVLPDGRFVSVKADELAFAEQR